MTASKVDSKYSLYQTQDESFTLTNHEIDENYHSNAGAWQEARIKYFDACKVIEKSRKNSITIFEVGFGLGYNLIPILENLENIDHKLTYITSEYDTDIFETLLKNSDQLYPKNLTNIFKILLKDKSYNSNKIEIKVLNGDVRQSIQEIAPNSIDIIYHDPFSPYKNTECWTLEFFQQEYRIMKSEAILSTYSMSTPVRSGMFQAGLFVYDGIGDQTKSAGTMASKSENLELKLLPEKMYTKLFESPDRIPFMDKSLKTDRQKIKDIRLDKKKNGDYSDCKRK